MRHIATATGQAVANPNPNPNPGRGRSSRGPRARYIDAGRSGREAIARLSTAEAEARETGTRVPASCARILLEIVGQVTTYSRRNDALSVRMIEERTGMARSTVRRALGLLEGYGCITRITPENTPGQRTGSTLIALPVVEPDAQPDPAEDDAGEDEHAGGEGWTAPRYRGYLERPDDTPPGAPRRTRPLERLDAPATRSTYEKNVRAHAQRNAPPDRSPGGRPSGRPSPSLDGEPPKGNTHPDVNADEAAAAEERIREDIHHGRGVNPADARIVDRWAAHRRQVARGEAAA